ncbi:MAG: DNA mismatch repair protein MutS [Bacteroidales bacterium]|nr:DNA mismatch repair protein MutS [Bacteroidales bacterium]
MAKSELTPMMKQYYDLKAQHPDALMLFRCGDFYESYAEDAIEAARILGITLTHRSNKGAQAGTEMAGFPYHSLESYLPKLVRAGRRVAICDQLEDPKTTKKLVKRGITELVTPGVAVTDNVLQSKENNFLAAVTQGKKSFGLALLDLSTGEFLTAEGTAKDIDKLLENFRPKEVLVEQTKRMLFDTHFGAGFFVFALEDWCFDIEAGTDRLLKHFGVKSLKGYGVDHFTTAIGAAGAIMHYLQNTQHTHIGHITNIVPVDDTQYVRLDRFTERNLELVRPLNEGGRSLLQVIDNTTTPMGGRLLHRWLIFPLRQVEAINRRLDCVEYFFRQPEFSDLCTERLPSVGDLERLGMKVAMHRIGPREMQQLRLSLDAIVPLKQALEQADFSVFEQMGNRLEALDELRTQIARTLTLNPPVVVSKGGFIAEGVDAELDDLRGIATHGKDRLLEIQMREAEATGIPSLKISFNNVFGYYIEVRNTYKERVPNTWIRKQTLTQAERYITEELKAYEEKILGAEGRIQAIEQRLFEELITAAARHIMSIQSNARLIAELDCLHGLATTARHRRYARPLVDDTTVIDIKAGRHPVIETQLPAGESYVANDVRLDTDTQQVIMLTGPNMAGKSALLRQTALIALLAQIGSFVPAEAARIGLVDKIFTRVGASDNISMGESTFMVEMNEAANIMNNLTPRSLVLFDELGRGTSTYDGISLAWAIVEHIHQHDNSRARTLFATHYHELNAMEQLYPRIKNYNVSVREIDGHVVFVRKLERGGSEHSFGIHVARLAGMPPSIVQRAEAVLSDLERHTDRSRETMATIPEALHQDTKHTTSEQVGGVQMNFFQLDDPILVQIREELRSLDINNLTPLDALNTLSNIKRVIGQ